MGSQITSPYSTHYYGHTSDSGTHQNDGEKEQISRGRPQKDQFIRFYCCGLKKSPTFVMIHGGYWMNQWHIDNALWAFNPSFFTDRQCNLCVMEYRRVGHMTGGGWPNTNNDIVDGIKKFASLAKTKGSIDLSKVIIMGHSAGGHLALWACCRLALRAYGFSPLMCVALAPVGDLEAAYTRRESGEYVERYMGCPPASKAAPEDAYMQASPARLLPLEASTIIVVGSADVNVPPDLVVDFHAKAAAAETAGAGSQKPAGLKGGLEDVLEGELGRGVQKKTNVGPLLYMDNVNHFQIVDTSHGAWLEIYRRICTDYEKLTGLPMLSDPPPWYKRVRDTLVCRTGTSDTVHP